MLVAASVFFTSCGTSLPAKGTAEYDSAVSAFYVGLAALQVGFDERAAADLKRATEIAPGEPAAWNNLGVLQLRQRDFENAGKSFDKAIGLEPQNSRLFFNKAVLAQQNGDPAASVENLEKVLELDPGDLKAAYSLALEFEKQKKDKEALERFDGILKAAPDNLAVMIESARLNAKLGDTEKLDKIVLDIGKNAGEWPEEASAQYEKLKKAPVAEKASEIAFLRNVLLRVPAFRASIDAVKASDTVLGEVFSRSLKLEVPEFAAAAPDTSIDFVPESVSKEKAVSMSVVYLNGDDPPTMAVSNGDSTTVGEASIPFSVNSPEELAVLDFDYDYKNDLAFAGKSGFRLFRQTSDGKFEDVTEKTSVPENIRSTEYAGVWNLDFDNEGDLDLLLAPVGKAPFVLRNNGNGTFAVLNPFDGVTDVKQFEYADLDEDGDSDAVLLQSDGKMFIFLNERGDIFEKSEENSLEGIAAITIADSNGNGILDLIAFTADGKVNRAKSLVRDGGPQVELIPAGLGDCREQCSISSADFDNNGANDLLLSIAGSSRLFLSSENGKFVAASRNPDIGAVGVADFNGDGKLDLAGLGKNGEPVRLINKSAKNYHWQVFRPKSVKTEGDQRINTFGIGGEIEIRAGLLSQKQLIRTPRVHFGLGTAEKADVARIVWQNGYVQADFDFKTDQTIAAEQRLKGSCPHLFAWNGKEFSHVKDAPPWSPALGLKINAQETYGILQTEEWFKIPGEALKPKDGFYELRITGEYWEAYYIDHYRLMAVDHPESTEVFADERFAIPLPPLKVFSTETPKPFKSAIDHNGNNVYETVLKLDEKYLDDIKRGRYQGIAEDHYVELELPDDAPRDKKLWVIGDGWVHPTDASINVQRGQDIPTPPKSLSIEVENEKGEWKPVKENLGFPAGKMKTVLLDLEGVFDPARQVRKIRLRTEMEIFWDKLAWAVDVPGAENQTREIGLDSASLRYRGFSVIEKRDDSSPEVPDYGKLLTTGQRWRDLEGYYTRYGDIRELLLKIDDRFVLSNAGDEIVMKFPALPDVKPGYKRDFVIIGNGWIKDGDLNSVFSKTVLPLPTQATNDYSRRPTRLEDDPVYQKNRRDWIDFHTRYIAPDRFRNAVRLR